MNNIAYFEIDTEIKNPNIRIFMSTGEKVPTHFHIQCRVNNTERYIDWYQNGSYNADLEMESLLEFANRFYELCLHSDPTAKTKAVKKYRYKNAIGFYYYIIIVNGCAALTVWEHKTITKAENKQYMEHYIIPFVKFCNEKY